MARVRRECPPTAKRPGLAEVIGFFLGLRWRGFGPGDTLETSPRAWRDLAAMTLLKQPEAQAAVYPNHNAPWRGDESAP